MTTTYRSRDQRIADEAIGPDEERMPCAFCGGLAARKVLSALGSRCSPCYEAYCREAPTSGRVNAKAALAKMATIGQASRNPREWAAKLRDRERAGEYLTPFQREAWRSAIRDGATE